MTDPILLNRPIRSTLLTLQRTQTLIDETTLKLATGRKVNSALDNPQNFFAAKSLDNRADDLARRLDGIGQSISTVQEALTGLEGIERLLQLGKSVALTELERRRIEGDSLIVPVDPLSTQILALNPEAYWRLNETAGTTAVNLGTLGAAVNGTYAGGPALGATALYADGDVSADFFGGNERVNIPNNPAINTSAQTNRTVELVFNADDVISRQVLFEEGATINALNIYIDNGRVYVVGRDAGAWGPQNISIPIVAGQTYHVAFTLDSIAGEFIGYVNGQEIGRDVVTATFPSHSGAVAIGRNAGGTWFHDGANGGNGEYFDGRISDVALYNSTLSAQELLNHANSVLGVVPTDDENAEFNMIMDQITALAEDSGYRGTNLLLGDTLRTLFNENGSSNLDTEGTNATSEGLGIERVGFNTAAGILAIIDSVDAAIEQVRSFSRSLAFDVNILNIREDFTHNLINNLSKGADKLTLADMNEEGANLLALQTRQQLGVTALSIAAQSNGSVLDLFA